MRIVGHDDDDQPDIGTKDCCTSSSITAISISGK